MRHITLVLLIALAVPLTFAETKEEKRQKKEQEQAMLARSPEVEIPAGADPAKAALGTL